jgi:hypothetical protein
MPWNRWQSDILMDHNVEYVTISRMRVMSGALWPWNFEVIYVKSKGVLTERFEIALFQNGCLAFRSPANIVLCLKLKS